MQVTHKTTNIIKTIMIYSRHISFIAFLVAIILLYPSFEKTKYGTICFYISIVYIITTFIMFFIKNKQEETNLLNNFVLIFMHLYICFIAYKYQTIANYLIDSNTSYFSFNYIIISICITVLIINKLLISNT